MAFGKAKAPPFPTGDSSASDADDASSSESDDDASESSSQARPDQMKGSKPHPLRRWAASKVEAIAKGFFGSKR